MIKIIKNTIFIFMIFVSITTHSKKLISKVSGPKEFSCVIYDLITIRFRGLFFEERATKVQIFLNGVFYQVPGDQVRVMYFKDGSEDFLSLKVQGDGLIDIKTINSWGRVNMDFKGVYLDDSKIHCAVLDNDRLINRN